MQEKENRTAPPRRIGPGGGQGIMGGGKPKNFYKAIGKLAGYMGKMLPLIIIALVMAAGSAFISIIIPRKLGDIAGVITEGLRAGSPVNMQTVEGLGVVLAVFIVLGVICYVMQGVIMTEVTQRTGKRLRTDLDKKINRLPLSYYDSQSFGDVLSRVTNDVDTITTSTSNSITQLLYTVVLMIGLSIMMFISSWVLALVTLATVPLSILIIAGIVRFSQKHFKAHQKSLGQLSGHIEEIYSGHEVIKTYGGEAKAKLVFDEHNRAMAKAAWRSNFLSGLMFPITNFVANLGLIAVCVVGGVLIVNQSQIGVGDIVAFIFYIRLFTNPITQLAQTMTGLQSAAAASERVFDFLGNEEMPPDVSAGKKPAVIDAKEVRGKVEFKDVWFGYSADKPVIKGFCAQAKAGQKVAIVGATGAGKTTLVSLLMRFYEIDSGEILIDGVPISSMTRADVRKLFGMVLQDTWLFNGTIRDNIAYARPSATPAEVEAAALSAGIDHIIRALPGGYGMMIDDKSTLSMGEKQLVTIARAIIQDAPMLILDEATSAVDTRTELLIQAAMDKLTQGRTSFIIAHRLSTVKNADLILVMEGGDIVEQGTHDELLKNGGAYAELYKHV